MTPKLEKFLLRLKDGGVKKELERSINQIMAELLESNMQSVALILDTETTGLKDPEPVEIGFLALRELISYPNGLLAEKHIEFCERFATNKAIEPDATKVHKIKDIDLIGKPHWRTFKIPDTAKYMIGHNIEFDARVLNYPKLRFICTLKLSRLLWPDLPNHKLTTVIQQKFPGVAERLTANAHGALVDCKLCLLILHTAMQEFDGFDTWQNVWMQAGVEPKKKDVKVPDIMPFGKYKGTRIADIPRDYLEWMLQNMELSGGLKIAVQNTYAGAKQ
jgi:exodeoxyribonuclease X